MQLPDIKQLKDLLKLLRSQGVLQYQSTDLNLVLSENAPASLSKRSQAEDIMSEDEELTPEQEAERLLFYSAGSPSQDIK